MVAQIQPNFTADGQTTAACSPTILSLMRAIRDVVFRIVFRIKSVMNDWRRMRLHMRAAPSFTSRFVIRLTCLFLAGVSNFAAAPTISIVRPVPYELFIVPVNGSTNVTVAINASSPHPERRIESVQLTVRKLPFLDLLTYTLTNPPYTVVLTKLPESSYHVRAAAVDDLGTSSAIVTNSFQLGRYVTNDFFADRALLTGDTVRVIARTDGATREPGEPFTPFFGSPYTVWWRWVAPSTGYYDLVTTGNEIDAFTGSNVAALQTVSFGYGAYSWDDRYYKRLPAQEGVEYAIRVGTAAIVGPAPPEVSLAISRSPALSLITPVVGAVYRTSPDNPAVVEFAVDDLPSSRRFSHVDFQVWDTTFWNYELGDPLVDIRIVVEPPFVAAITNIPAGKYFAYVQAYDELGLQARSGFRPFVIKDDTVLNDDFANSFLAEGPFFRLSATNLHRATTEPEESGGASLGSVWWHWTAPVSARYAIRNFGSYLSFSVYTGDSLSSLTAVMGTSSFPAYFDATAGVTYHFRMLGYHSIKDPANIQIVPAPAVSITSPQADAIFPRGGNIRFEASATSLQSKIVRTQFSISNNTTVLARGASTVAPYHFTWKNVLASSTPYTVTVSAYDVPGLSTTSAPVRFSVPLLPINDNFSAAINLSGAMVQGAASAVDATTEPNEPQLVSSETLWWNWTSPADGDFEVTLLGNFASAMHIYRGASLDAVDSVAALTNNYPTSITRTLMLHANAGQTYRIRMSPYPTNTSQSLPLTFQIRPLGDLPAPTVRITAPQEEQSFTTGSRIAIHAESSADYPVLEDGFLDQAYVATVELFANDQSLGRIFADSRDSDFTLIWTNRQTGRFVLTAKAGDQTRAFTTSNPVAVNLTLPQQIELRLVEMGANQFKFAIVGPTDHTYSVRASTNLVTWTVVATNLTSSSSIANFLDLPPNSSSQTFYQATVP